MWSDHMFELVLREHNLTAKITNQETLNFLAVCLRFCAPENNKQKLMTMQSPHQKCSTKHMQTGWENSKKN